jgi:hypothetical protein
MITSGAPMIVWKRETEKKGWSRQRRHRITRALMRKIPHSTRFPQPQSLAQKPSVL